jgi:hypothetical protein
MVAQLRRPRRVAAGRRKSSPLQESSVQLFRRKFILFDEADLINGHRVLIWIAARYFIMHIVASRDALFTALLRHDESDGHYSGAKDPELNIP